MFLNANNALFERKDDKYKNCYKRGSADNSPKKSKRGNISFKNIAFVFAVILMAGVFIYLMVNIFTSGTDKYSFYLLETDSYGKQSTAEHEAEDLKRRNGGGYVYYNEKYRIIAAVYLTDSDCKKVAKNIKNVYSEAQMFKISKTVTADRELYKEMYNTIAYIYELNVALDKAAIDSADTVNELEDIYSRLRALKQNAKTQSAIDCAEHFMNTVSAIQDLIADVSLSRMLRYHAASLAVAFVES